MKPGIAAQNDSGTALTEKQADLALPHAINAAAERPIEAAPKDTGTVLAEQRTDLAQQRTIVALERTLMAWIRTALSMIGFGFTIYKFFQYLPAQIAAGNVRRPDAPRNLGLTLIAMGTLALVAAAWQHRISLNAIGAAQQRHIWSISFVVAIFVVLIGVGAFYGVLLRSGPF